MCVCVYRLLHLIYIFRNIRFGALHGQLIFHSVAEKCNSS